MVEEPPLARETGVVCAGGPIANRPTSTHVKNTRTPPDEECAGRVSGHEVATTTQLPIIHAVVRLSL